MDKRKFSLEVKKFIESVFQLYIAESKPLQILLS